MERSTSFRSAAMVLLLLLFSIGKSQSVRRNCTVIMPQAPRMPLEWTQDQQFANIFFALYPYSNPEAVMDDNFKLPTNKGREAMTYLTFIIQFYDELPLKMLFLHGHHTAWHQGWPMEKLISSLRWDQIDGYMNLRSCGYDPYNHMFRGMHTDIQTKDKGEVFPWLLQFWEEFEMPRYGFPKISKSTIFECYCCAQFVVDRKSVKRLSKGFYVSLREWLLNTQWEDRISSRVMEYLWHILFTGSLRNSNTVSVCERMIAMGNESLTGKYKEFV